MDYSTHATMAPVQVVGPDGGHGTGVPGSASPGSASQGAAFERATRAGESALCFRIGVDHPERIARRHGPVAAAAVVPALLELATELARPREVLAALLPDELCLVVFAEPSIAEGLGRSLLDGARELRIPGRGDPLRVSLSIGMAHNRRHGPPAWNTVLAVAEEGLEVARGGGGGRHVHTELYELYQPSCTPEKGVSLTSSRTRTNAARKLGAGKRSASEDPSTAPAPGDQARDEAPAAAEPRAALPAEPVGGPFAQASSEPAVRADALQSPAPTPQGFSTGAPRASEVKNADALRAELEELYQTKYQQIYDDRMSGHSRQVDVLQRRIAKLTQLLGTTEQELVRVAQMKTVDGGIPSVYRGLQGLSPEDGRFELKRDLMTTIFEANLRLRGRQLQQS